jgi:hypothetical protein
MMARSDLIVSSMTSRSGIWARKSLIGEHLLVLIYNPLDQICLCERRLVLFG